jgi:hypothetical protein
MDEDRKQSIHTSEELERSWQLPLLRDPEQVALCLLVEPRVYDHGHRPREPDVFTLSYNVLYREIIEGSKAKTETRAPTLSS